MKRRIGIALVVVVCVAAICAAVVSMNDQAREFAGMAPREEGSSARAGAAQMKAAAPGGRYAIGGPMVAGEPAVADGVTGGTVTLAAVQASQPDRYLVRNASITVETKDARAAYDRLVETVRLLHGYMGNMQIEVDALGTRSVSAEMRVPSDQFDAAMQKVEALGKVLSESAKSDDVTEEFTDAEARVRNLRVTEKRLLDHLSRSAGLSDTLAVEREVSRVRLEIEQISGRLRFLSHRIAFSTISVTLQEAPRVQGLVPAETYSSGKVAGEASRSLVGFLQAIWSVVIWLVVWSPVWLVCGAILWIAARRYVRAGGPVPPV